MAGPEKEFELSISSKGFQEHDHFHDFLKHSVIMEAAKGNEVELGQVIPGFLEVYSTSLVNKEFRAELNWNSGFLPFPILGHENFQNEVGLNTSCSPINGRICPPISG